MFATAVVVIIVYCMLRMLAKISGWLFAILLVAALLDPQGARLFFHAVFYWLAQVWERLLFILGF